MNAKIVLAVLLTLIMPAAEVEEFLRGSDGPILSMFQGAALALIWVWATDPKES